MEALRELAVENFCQLKATSAASMTRPLVGGRSSHLSPGRSLKVTWSLSPLTS